MKKTAFLLAALILASAGFWYFRRAVPSDSAPRLAEVVRGPFRQWSGYEGVLESRNMQVILSSFKGSTTIIYLIADGSPVAAGDLVAELDASRIGRDLAQLKHDLRAALADLTSLERAELPLTEADIKNELFETRYTYETEMKYLNDSRALLQDQLVSDQEVLQQEHKVAALKARLDRLEAKDALTREFIHPTRLERARAAVAALEYQINDLDEQVAQCRITAPSGGIVTFSPTYVGGEYRAVRVGDTVAQNQPLMSIPDMSNLLVSCYVPEADLSRVQPASPATITPVSFPHLKLRGEVESVGAMAQRLRGMPSWQKYFLVNIALREHDPCLRSGMSVRADILSRSSDDALLLPRLAARWEDDAPYCLLDTPSGPQRRALRLGAANDLHYEVLDGLQAGDRVLLP